jgi:hypothetical protein
MQALQHITDDSRVVVAEGEGGSVFGLEVRQGGEEVGVFRGEVAACVCANPRKKEVSEPNPRVRD